MMKRYRSETSSTEAEPVSKRNRPEISKESATTSYVGPIVDSYNHRMRPLVDAVDRLRNLQINIPLPTIVVVGDQSSGKSGVLGSLTGICLPTGTRVPLIMKLENHTNPKPELSIEFDGKIISTNEENVANDIIKYTEEIAGKGNWISETPLALTVKLKGVPNLTMVDLPGVIRIPEPGQPDNIYERISEIILDYITPDESIILNVVPAFIDFSTCESTWISKQVDKTGQRTLAVITNADRSPEELLEKVTADDLNIGLGYVCVRNRIGDETQEEARAEEASIFETNKFLCKIDKSMVGIPVLAERLMEIHYTIIIKCLPDILPKINDKLEEMNNMKLNSVAFLDCVKLAVQSLKNIFFGEQFVTDLLKSYRDEMLLSFTKSDSNYFMEDEIILLEERWPTQISDFGVDVVAFRSLLEKKVDEISAKPFECVEKIWRHVEEKVMSVLGQHCGKFIPGTRRAARDLIERKKRQSIDWISKLIEMEKHTCYTCNPQYTASLTNLMSEQVEFINKVHANYESALISKFGEVNIVHLWKYRPKLLEGAYDLKMRMTSYWDIVTSRMIDNLVHHLNFTIQNLVEEMELEITYKLMRPQDNELQDQKSKDLHHKIAQGIQENCCQRVT